MLYVLYQYSSQNVDIADSKTISDIGETSIMISFVTRAILFGMVDCLFNIAKHKIRFQTFLH